MSKLTGNLPCQSGQEEWCSGIALYKRRRKQIYDATVKKPSGKGNCFSNHLQVRRKSTLRRNKGERKRRRAMKGLQLFVFSAVLVTAHTLTVETPAKELQVARGSNATLRCQFNTDASVSGGDFVVWKKINTADDAVTRYFDGLVQYGKGYETRIQFTGNVENGDISITINEVTMEDNGTYVCSVRLRNDPPRQSAITSLYVLIAPSKPECKIVGTAEYGQTINLTCISHEGSPKPTYSWESFNVQHEPRVLQTTKGEQITLKNISADTSGFYICTSTNIVGKESCNMTVSVVPPSMNIALYAGIIGGAVVAIVVIGIIAYCCCCRGDKNTDYEMTETKDADEFSQRNPTENQTAKDDNEDE